MPASSRWVAFRSIGYCTGRGVIFGADYEIYPSIAQDPEHFAVYADVGKHAPGLPQPAVVSLDLTALAKGAFDYVFVGPHLRLHPDPVGLLGQAAGLLKPGGHLLVHLPVEVFPAEVVDELVSGLSAWVAKDTYERDGTRLAIYKKAPGRVGLTRWQRPAAPRACVVRYGAMGDMVMVTALLAALKADGFHVTVNCTRYSAPILDNNPNVDNVILQEKDAIPNFELGAYWEEWKNDYDRYINLSESIEGRLLKVEGRRDYFTHAEWRRRDCAVNYYDYTLKLGGYPEAVGRRGELYFSSEEERWARKFRDRFRGKFVLLWALNGSSHHKMYGLFQPVLSDWLDAHPDAVAVTLGDGRARELEFDHPQLVKMAGELPIRKSLALTKVADCVVGPESVITNAAGCFDTPKVVFLSHSTPENLTKYWVNCQALTPDPAVAACYPCHQLHYTLESCPLLSICDEQDKPLLTGPACAMGAISGERVINALDSVYNNRGAGGSGTL